MAVEAEVSLRGVLSPGIGGHDEDDVAEISLLPLVVSEDSIVHNLQQYIIDVAMCLFYLVEQQHTVWCLADGIGEQAAILVADIACR